MRRVVELGLVVGLVFFAICTAQEEFRDDDHALLHFLESRSSEECRYHLGIRSRAQYCYRIYPDILAEISGVCVADRDRFVHERAQRGQCTHEITTQMSEDRIFRLQRLLEEWDGLVSATLYVPQHAVTRVLAKVQDAFARGKWPVRGKSRETVDCLEESRTFRSRPSDLAERLRLHILVAKYDSGFQVGYPINLMRNIAFQYGFSAAKLSAVYDIDFVPSRGLCDILSAYETNIPGSSVHWLLEQTRDDFFYDAVAPANYNISRAPQSVITLPERSQERGSLDTLELDPRLVLLVVPAFEILDKPVERSQGETWKAESVDKFYVDKSAISESFRGTISTFHERWPGQRVGVQYWLGRNKSFVIPSETVDVLEPYGWFLRKPMEERLRESGMSLCESNFFDRGFNKISCYRTARTMQLVPLVIPDGWIVHHPEPKKYRTMEFVRDLRRLFETSVCLGYYRRFGKSQLPWVAAVCSQGRSADGGSATGMPLIKKNPSTGPGQKKTRLHAVSKRQGKKDWEKRMQMHGNSTHPRVTEKNNPGYNPWSFGTSSLGGTMLRENSATGSQRKSTGERAQQTHSLIDKGSGRTLWDDVTQRFGRTLLEDERGDRGAKTSGLNADENSNDERDQGNGFIGRQKAGHVIGQLDHGESVTLTEWLQESEVFQQWEDAVGDNFARMKSIALEGWNIRVVNCRLESGIDCGAKAAYVVDLGEGYRPRRLVFEFEGDEDCPFGAALSWLLAFLGRELSTTLPHMIGMGKSFRYFSTALHIHVDVGAESISQCMRDLVTSVSLGFEKFRILAKN
eukprot:CAMPEP_0119138446 /NCGR_PEP_ID=MMETSP1310-20130426/25657_1 /TAXON_ID=464262 /ORGANISM="Genus nov. species nov., Strain RCC2339" /LENGTH=800 /DNA_ID=CAMNT_0007129637 /DNA_START=59 /DNA_END=2462 /DNA_ORIENTATION=-